MWPGEKICAGRGDFFPEDRTKGVRYHTRRGTPLGGKDFVMDRGGTGKKPGPKTSGDTEAEN